MPAFLLFRFFLLKPDEAGRSWDERGLRSRMCGFWCLDLKAGYNKLTCGSSIQFGLVNKVNRDSARCPSCCRCRNDVADIYIKSESVSISLSGREATRNECDLFVCVCNDGQCD